MPPNVFINHAAGDVLPAADWASNWSLVETSFGVVGPFIQTGLVPTAGSGLAVNISSGNALIGANVVKAAGWTITSLTDSAVNHLYMNQSGTGTSNTTGTQPANSVKLGTATTAGGVVTSVNTSRSSGRQVFVRSENQVPGAVGSPGSINLASWNATAGDGFQVYGTLPAAAGGLGATSTQTTNYTLLATDYAVFGDATSGSITITLPAASGNNGKQYFANKKDASANTVTLKGNGAELIDGVNTYVLSTRYQSVSVISDGTVWYVQ